jgi:hypothetical protein
MMHCEFDARTFDTFLLAISESKASHLRELRSEFSEAPNDLAPAFFGEPGVGFGNLELDRAFIFLCGEHCAEDVLA